MIDEQVDLELKIVELLDRTRRFAADLQEQRESVEDDSDRAEALDAALAKLETEEGTYMPARLIDQTSYLYQMIANADQAPGDEAKDRYRVLSEEFAAIEQSL